MVQKIVVSLLLMQKIVVSPFMVQKIVVSLLLMLVNEKKCVITDLIKSQRYCSNYKTNFDEFVLH